MVKPHNLTLSFKLSCIKLVTTPHYYTSLLHLTWCGLTVRASLGVRKISDSSGGWLTFTRTLAWLSATFLLSSVCMPPTNAVVSSYPVSGLSDSGSLSSLDSVITVGSFFGFLKMSGSAWGSSYCCTRLLTTVTIILYMYVCVPHLKIVQSFRIKWSKVI